MLGQPALVAGHDRGDAQREALLARAGRCRRSPSRRTRSRGSRGSGRCTWSRVAGPGDVGLPGLERRADGVHGTARTRRPSPSASSAALPMRVMIRMRDGHVGRVGDSTPMLGDRRAERAHARRARRTWCARACSPSNSSRQRRAHLVRVDPVVGRAGVVLVLGADEGAVLDAGHVAGVGGAGSCWAASRVEPDERAVLDQLVGQPVLFGLGAVAPDDRSGLVSSAISRTHLTSSGRLVPSSMRSVLNTAITPEQKSGTRHAHTQDRPERPTLNARITHSCLLCRPR